MNTLHEIAKHFGIPLVEQSGVVDDLDAFINRADAEEGNEGYILRFDSGHMLKVKNSWYVRIHKVKDKIRTDRHILALLLNNELDDVYPHLDEADHRRVKLFEFHFHESLKETARIMTADIGALTALAEGKKDLAVNIVPKSSLTAIGKKTIFRAYDRMLENPEFDIAPFVYDELMAYVESRLGNTAKYNEMAAVLGLAADQGEDE